ncbi:MAG TPA: hypothetical protein VIM30_12155 [Candidatus Limnocylindrales bacterium]
MEIDGGSVAQMLAHGLRSRSPAVAANVQLGVERVTAFWTGERTMQPASASIWLREIRG